LLVDFAFADSGAETFVPFTVFRPVDFMMAMV
jgi:hypothetical protein